MRVYAFQTWGTDGVSAIYQGDAALDFVASHHASGTFADLHVGGLDVLDSYVDRVNALTPSTHQGVTRANFL